MTQADQSESVMRLLLWERCNPSQPIRICPETVAIEEPLLVSDSYVMGLGVAI